MMTCPKHPDTRSLFRWKTFANGTRHIERRCGECGLFLEYAVQTPERIAETLPESPQERTLFDYQEWDEYE